MLLVVGCVGALVILGACVVLHFVVRLYFHVADWFVLRRYRNHWRRINLPSATVSGPWRRRR